MTENTQAKDKINKIKDDFLNDLSTDELEILDDTAGGKAKQCDNLACDTNC
ncbi:hypothetical protein HQQ94_17155 [Shewanella sp. VB17]|uniref:hypothetical protein n=1 Tax=Shewanella sp. VB17 TaxID=2739432 RepID=UPI0015652E60|nr:hypothetical protein [Shewanella sp. VB17]NRD74912.1 hypothetical protein [Shewanella sp. VB17]